MAIRKKNGNRKSSRKEKTVKHLQQGDVCLEVSPIPGGASKRTGANSAVLAEGEATGHAHRVQPIGKATVETYEFGQRLFLRIMAGDCRVIHEEHGPITVPAGDYEIGRVLEYDYDAEEARQVQD